MRIAVTGSTGMIGKALVAELRASGHTVTRVVRTPQASSEREQLVSWDPKTGSIDAEGLENHAALVHLAGASIFGLWTPTRKQAILDSRVQGTTLLSRSLAGLRHPPRVLITASAIGYYGDRPANESLAETAAAGRGFLAEVVQRWEQSAEPARTTGIRVAHTRFGLILTPSGGALGAMLPIFQLGLGGRLGSGDQIWSWVTLPDVIGAIQQVIARDELSGPVNVAAPGAVSNAEFTRTLGRVLHRPTLFHVPRFVLHAVLREMADELLLSGAKVVPRKLLDTGFRFRHGELEPALRALLNR